MKYRRACIYLDFIQQLDTNRYRIEGYFGGNHLALEEVKFILDGKLKSMRWVKRDISHEGSDMHHPIRGSAFELEISTKSDRSRCFEVIYKGKRMPLQTNRFTNLSGLGMSYCVKGSQIVLKERHSITFFPYEEGLVSRLERRYIWQIIYDWRFYYVRQKISYAGSLRNKIATALKMVGLMAETVAFIPRAIILRRMYRKDIKKKNAPLWIMSDRPTTAGDNGEALFCYINSSKVESVADIYFAISKKSEEYKKLSSLGKVLDYGSFGFFRKFLLADKVISSHADIEIINPFMRQFDHYADLLKFDFIFLQHGVIRTDLSNWLNRYNRNIKLFITSSERERRSILDLPYYYERSDVVLTGLPRFDKLQNNPKGKIIIAPTYRKYLLGHSSNRYGLRKYNHEFKKSDYFMFYNRMIQDERLNKTLIDNNVSAEFYLHPVLYAQVLDFTPGRAFKVAAPPYNYSLAFSEANLLVSDYSSVVFDFAYLKKPIIYAQFDKDTFYKNHSIYSDTTSDDERDGFGVVCYDYDTVVDSIVRYISDGLGMPDEYKDRVDRYFSWIDDHNSSRTYEAILGMNRKEFRS